MSYIPHSSQDIAEMLQELGLKSLADLFSHIPASLRKNTADNLPDPLSESQLWAQAQQLADKNFKGVSFAGFGLYQHYIPAAVHHLGSLRPFVTAYTPYQPEVAQGILQALFEYQSLMAELTSMAIANASLYDGATAMVEAVRMALRQKTAHGRPTVVALSQAIHSNYLAVFEAYFPPHIVEQLNIQVVMLPVNMATGQTGFDIPQADILVWQSPNVFGVVESAAAPLRQRFPEAQLLYGTNEPHTLTVLPAPAEYGADIVWGEAQALGIPISLGGPSLGFLAAKAEYMRQMPGRLVGQTTAKTSRGEPCEAYVITLATREQHIRREKATSNICSNQTLMAIRSAVYMALRGWSGLQETIAECVSHAEYFIESLRKIDPYLLAFPEGDFFHEVAWRSERQTDIFAQAMSQGIFPGVALDSELTVTYFPETTKRRDIDRLLDIICKNHV